MHRLPRRGFAVPALALTLVAAALAGCSKKSGTEVAVTADAPSCEAAQTALTAGTYSFKVTNKGSSSTELYVYETAGGSVGKKVDEVEGIGPGTTRTLTVDLDAGTYQLQCKPGGKVAGTVDLTVS